MDHGAPEVGTEPHLPTSVWPTTGSEFGAPVIVEDCEHSITKHMPKSFEIKDEIYESRTGRVTNCECSCASTNPNST
jgi:hypothetical protein